MIEIKATITSEVGQEDLRFYYRVMITGVWRQRVDDLDVQDRAQQRCSCIVSHWPWSKPCRSFDCPVVT